MASELRIVVDTGVAISAALLPRSVPRQAVDAALSHGRLLISEAVTLELDDVFRRPKFDKYVRQETRLEFLAALVRDAELVDIAEAIKACRDPKDDKFLELAVNGKATHLIKSDPPHQRRCRFAYAAPLSRHRNSRTGGVSDADERRRNCATLTCSDNNQFSKENCACHVRVLLECLVERDHFQTSGAGERSQIGVIPDFG